MKDRVLLSFFPPVLCDTRLQVLWGNWLHNQTFPNSEHSDAGVRWEGAAVTVGAEIFLYLDC